MKTTIDEIIKASEFFSIIEFKKWFDEEKGRLKEKEKQQIIDAANHELQIRNMNGESAYNSGAEYYEKSFS